jgi:hypothetical protein
VRGTVVACVGDLTRQDVDVVVNAANEHLQHGGGVAAALARAGGAAVREESDAHVATHGPVEPGSAAVTTAGALPARHIVHVVGPRYRRGQDNAGCSRRRWWQHSTLPRSSELRSAPCPRSPPASSATRQPLRDRSSRSRCAGGWTRSTAGHRGASRGLRWGGSRALRSGTAPLTYMRTRPSADSVRPPRYSQPSCSRAPVMGA